MTIDDNIQDLGDFDNSLRSWIPPDIQAHISSTSPGQIFNYVYNGELIASAFACKIELSTNEIMTFVDGGFFGEHVKGVYDNNFPSLEIASKFHLYDLARLGGISDEGKVSNNISKKFFEWLGLPEEYLEK